MQMFKISDLPNDTAIVLTTKIDSDTCSRSMCILLSLTHAHCSIPNKYR